MSKVTATVLFPIQVVFETEEQSPDVIWQKIIETADKELNNNAKTLAPVISDCSIKSIIDLNPPINKELDSQSDWVNVTINALRAAKESLKPAIQAAKILKPSLASKVLDLQKLLEETLLEIASH